MTPSVRTALEMSFSDDEIERLRTQHYNATAERVHFVHEDLMILRVRPDEGPLQFAPGQYTVLGLGLWEWRIDDIVPARVTDALRRRPLIRRIYSISCPMLDEQGCLVTSERMDEWEFYLVRIRRPSDDPPMLTPRLFALREGDRLFLGPRPRGRYTLDPVGPEDDVILAATGTGEAPHNAMAAELLARRHRGRIICCTGVRHRKDLGYLEVHRDLEQRFSNYRYIPLTTREPENIDPAHPNYVGKQYLQDFFASGRFEEQAGLGLDPDRTHVFLCGNPAMIGLPQKTEDGQTVFPEPIGMAEVLVQRGFRLDERRRPGNIHVETYW